MTKSYSTNLNACIIDKEHLLRLMNEVSLFFDDTTVSFYFTDNTSISEVTREEFDEFDFSNRQIKNMRMSLFKSDFQTGKVSSVELEHEYDKSYSLSVSSTDYGEYSKLKTIIDEWVKSICYEKRKSILVILQHEVLFSFLLSVLLLSSIIAIFLVNSKLNINLGFLLLFFILYICSFVLSDFVLNHLKNSFPRTEIDIGINIAKKKRKRSWIFISVYFIPFVYMLIQSFIGRIQTS